MLGQSWTLPIQIRVHHNKLGWSRLYLTVLLPPILKMFVVSYVSILNRLFITMTKTKFNQKIVSLYSKARTKIMLTYQRHQLTCSEDLLPLIYCQFGNTKHFSFHSTNTSNSKSSFRFLSSTDCNKLITIHIEP